MKAPAALPSTVSNGFWASSPALPASAAAASLRTAWIPVCIAFDPAKMQNADTINPSTALGMIETTNCPLNPQGSPLRINGIERFQGTLPARVQITALTTLIG